MVSLNELQIPATPDISLEIVLAEAEKAAAVFNIPISLAKVTNNGIVALKAAGAMNKKKIKIEFYAKQKGPQINFKMNHNLNLKKILKASEPRDISSDEDDSAIFMRFWDQLLQGLGLEGRTDIGTPKVWDSASKATSLKPKAINDTSAGSFKPRAIEPQNVSAVKPINPATPARAAKPVSVAKPAKISTTQSKSSKSQMISLEQFIIPESGKVSLESIQKELESTLSRLDISVLDSKIMKNGIVAIKAAGAVNRKKIKIDFYAKQKGFQFLCKMNHNFNLSKTLEVDEPRDIDADVDDSALFLQFWDVFLQRVGLLGRTDIGTPRNWGNAQKSQVGDAQSRSSARKSNKKQGSGPTSPKRSTILNKPIPKMPSLSVTCYKCGWIYSSGRSNGCTMCGASMLLTEEELIKALEDFVDLQGVYIEPKEAKNFIRGFKKNYKELPSLKDLWTAAVQLGRIDEMDDDEIKRVEDERKRKEELKLKERMKQIQDKKLAAKRLKEKERLDKETEERKRKEQERLKKQQPKPKRQASKAWKICPSCSTQNPTDSKFCLECGNLLGDAGAAQPTPQAQPAPRPVAQPRPVANPQPAAQPRPVSQPRPVANPQPAAQPPSRPTPAFKPAFSPATKNNQDEDSSPKPKRKPSAAGMIASLKNEDE
jgi:predicted  nucleic acid-binding Zn-ribbon protein